MKMSVSTRLFTSFVVPAPGMVVGREGRETDNVGTITGDRRNGTR